MRLAIIALTLLALLCSPVSAQTDNLVARLTALANSGNAEASYHLGMLYNNGIGVPQDNVRALVLFRAGAQAGDPLAAYKVGCYFAGQFGVVEPNEDEALRFKLIAAQAGYRLAQVDVAIIYYRRENFDQARIWFEAAARQGDAQSLYNLSALSRDGRGAAPSRPRAYAFFRLAHFASRGSISAGAQEQLDEIMSAMNAVERAEAERLGATWITGPTPLTRLALSGQQRAEQLVRAGQ